MLGCHVCFTFSTIKQYSFGQLNGRYLCIILYSKSKNRGIYDFFQTFVFYSLLDNFICYSTAYQPKHINFLLFVIYLMSKPASKSAFDASKYVKKNLTADTVIKLKQVFDVFDYDGSGNISIDELVNTVKALNLETQAGQILGIVNAAGITGQFGFGTFIEIFGFGGDSTNEATLQTVFEAFDQGGHGAFGAEEFEKVAASVGEHFSSSQVDQMIEFADKDRDGSINYEQFVAVVSRVYPKV